MPRCATTLSCAAPPPPKRHHHATTSPPPRRHPLTIPPPNATQGTKATRYAGHPGTAPVTSKVLGKAKKVKKVKKAPPRSRKEQERAMQALSERSSPSHHAEWQETGQTEGEGEGLGTSMPYNLPPSPSRHASPGLSARDRSRLTARVDYATASASRGHTGGHASGHRTERSMTPQFDQVAMANAAIGTSMAVEGGLDHPAGPSERPVYKVMTVGGSKGRATTSGGGGGGGGGMARQYLPEHPNAPAPSQPTIPAPLMPTNGYPNADDGDQDTGSPGRAAGAATPASEAAVSTGSHTPGGGTQTSYLSQRFRAPSPQMILHDPHHDHQPPIFPDGDVPGAPGHQPLAVAVNRQAGPAHAEPLPHYVMPAMPEPMIEIYGGGGLEGEGLPRPDRDAAAGLGGAVGLGGFMTGGSLLEKGDGAAMRMSGTGTLASEGAPMGEKPAAVAEEGEAKEGGEADGAGDAAAEAPAAAEPAAAEPAADKPAEVEGNAADDAEKAADGEAKGDDAAKEAGAEAADALPPMSQEELDALVTFLVLDSMGREPGEFGGLGELDEPRAP